ncbi:MAG: glycosyltransferase [Ferruginibacter sp.]
MELNENINNKKPIRIIMAGGGTGGHIFPAIAIANAIKNEEPETEFLFIGAKGKMEMEKVPAAGYRIKVGYSRVQQKFFDKKYRFTV